MPNMVREEGNNHVYTEQVKFSFDIVPKRYNLPKTHKYLYSLIHKFHL